MSDHDDPFVELRDQLERAHDGHRLHPTPSPRPGWWRRPRIGVLAVGAILVTGTAVAATTPWNPKVGGDLGDRELSRSQQDVPEAQRTILGVLRREQTDADRNPAVLRALKVTPSTLGSGLRVNGIRLLRAHANRTVLLLPFRRVGPPGMPAQGFKDGLCLYTADVANPSSTPSGTPGFTSGAGCGSLNDVRRGRLRSTTTGLVPDGVARVRVTLTTGRTLTADVSDNYYELPIDVTTQGGGTDVDGAPFRSINGRPVVWLNDNGRAVPKVYR